MYPLKKEKKNKETYFLEAFKLNFGMCLRKAIFTFTMHYSEQSLSTQKNLSFSCWECILTTLPIGEAPENLLLKIQLSLYGVPHGVWEKAVTRRYIGNIYTVYLIHNILHNFSSMAKQYMPWLSYLELENSVEYLLHLTQCPMV